MGDTHQDPTDHSRTHHQHAGESMIDVYSWPGLISIALGIMSLVGSLAAAAYHHHEWILTLGVVGIMAILGGSAWLILEHHRVMEIESRWHADHPEGHPRTRVA